MIWKENPLRSLNSEPRAALLLTSLFLKILGSAFSAITLIVRSPALGVASAIICLVWFGLLFLSALPRTDRLSHGPREWLARSAKVSLVALILAGVGELVIIISFSLGAFKGATANVESLAASLQRVGACSDAMALEHQATDNFLAGKNPYEEANVITAGIECDVPSDKMTPLRTGQFATDAPYPDLGKLERVYADARANPSVVPPEFESKYNYPAASFMLPAPLVALGIDDLRIVFLVYLVPILGYVVWRLRSSRLRVYFLLGLAASLEVWNSLFSGGTGLLIFPLLLLAWLFYRKNLWLSALFMGLAIATKQIAWFLVPFYLILILREKGLTKALVASAVAGGVFLAFNLPYIVGNPGLWFSSVVAPMTDPLFPSNTLIIVFNYVGLINLGSSLPYTVVEVGVFIAALAWYFFNCRRYPDTALVLAVVPFFFAWRGSWGYYFYFDIILLAAILLESHELSGNQPIPALATGQAPEKERAA